MTSLKTMTGLFKQTYSERVTEVVLHSSILKGDFTPDDIESIDYTAKLVRFKNLSGTVSINQFSNKGLKVLNKCIKIRESSLWKAMNDDIK